MADEEDNGIKVIFLGESHVGKTNLIKISIGKPFEMESITTWAASYVPKEFFFKNQKYIFNLWDTIGQETYRSLTKIFFKGANIVILVYDITERKSFEELDYWYGQVKNELGDNFILAIVGNKIDLYAEEKVSEEEGQSYANEKGSKFALCSAKDDPKGFIKFLEELFQDYIEKYGNNIGNRQRGLSIRENNYKNKTIKCCS